MDYRIDMSVRLGERHRQADVIIQTTIFRFLNIELFGVSLVLKVPQHTRALEIEPTDESKDWESRVKLEIEFVMFSLN